VLAGDPLFGAEEVVFSNSKLHTTLYTHCTLALKQLHLNEKAPISGAFAKPSDGLEPSTPPYHGLDVATGRNPRQRFSPT
jgi:hypothetical protein